MKSLRQEWAEALGLELPIYKNRSIACLQLHPDYPALPYDDSYHQMTDQEREDYLLELHWK